MSVDNFNKKWLEPFQRLKFSRVKSSRLTSLTCVHRLKSLRQTTLPMSAIDYLLPLGSQNYFDDFFLLAMLGRKPRYIAWIRKMRVDGVQPPTCRHWDIGDHFSILLVPDEVNRPSHVYYWASLAELLKARLSLDLQKPAQWFLCIWRN